MISLIFAAALWSLNTYSAKVLRVVDGDTVRVTVRIWTDQDVYTSIRVRGLDTPELRGVCVAERELAQRAKARAEELMPPGSMVTISSVAADKFGGRHDADIVLADGRKLGPLLVDEGLARVYAGGKRAGWC